MGVSYRKVQKFYFKKFTAKQLITLLDLIFPVTLKYNEEMVNKIASQYPYVNKATISKIVLTSFTCMRELLILGKILNFNRLFFNTKLYFFSAHDPNDPSVKMPALKIKIKTPPSLSKTGKAKLREKGLLNDE
jgi:hypothetical protein